MCNSDYNKCMCNKIVCLFYQDYPSINVTNTYYYSIDFNKICFYCNVLLKPRHKNKFKFSIKHNIATSISYRNIPLI